MLIGALVLLGAVICIDRAYADAAAPSTTATREGNAGDATFRPGADDGTRIDRIGTSLGSESVGDHYFISSRTTANGPTMGDLAGRSVLNGTDLYATGFRSARRI